MRLFLIFIFVTFSFASLKDDFLNKKYSYVCNKGLKLFYHKNMRDENFLSMVGVACAKSDKINPLGSLLRYLKKTKSGRINAIYFTLLILEKKLLYSFMIDKTDISYYRLPKTDHILSKVINNLIKKNYTKKDNIYYIKDKNEEYKVYIKPTKIPFVVIDEIKNNKLLKRHLFR